jgi:hypothetical protein
MAFFYMVRPDDLSAINLEEVPEQRYWSIDILSSPVVELTRCYFDGKILRRGRLYYTHSFYGGDDRWVEKPEPFRSWAKRLLSAALQNSKTRPRSVGIRRTRGPGAKGQRHRVHGSLTLRVRLLKES